MSRAGSLLLLALCAGCAASAEAPADAPPTVVVHDVEGGAQRPLQVGNDGAHVLLFTLTDCPIANGYAPELARLQREFAPRGLRFYLVHADPDVEAERAREHAREYGLEGWTVLLDPDQALVAAVGATTTPEAAVLTAEGGLVYRGRVDDLYADLGVKRREPTRRDLRLTLEAVAAGRAVPVARTTAVGCDIPPPPAGDRR